MEVFRHTLTLCLDPLGNLALILPFLTYYYPARRYFTIIQAVLLTSLV